MPASKGIKQRGLTPPARLTVLLSTLALVLTSLTARAAETSDALLRLVGSDVGLCIELPRLEQTIPALRRSELFARLEQMPLYQTWRAGDDFRKLERTRAGLERLVEKPLPQFGRELFGRSVVVAVYAVPGSDPAGVLLTEAESEAVLEQALDAWNRAEPQQSETIAHLGREYVRRTRTGENKRPGESHFYVRLGPVLAISDREELIRRIIELDAEPAAAGSSTGNDGPSLLESPRYRSARQGLAPATVASAYVNPRAWDAALAAGPADDAAHQALLGFWRRCESLIFGAQLEAGLIAEAVVRFEAGAAPPEWERLAAALRSPPRLLNRVPAGALVVLTGRHDLGRIARWLEPQLNDQDRREWRQMRQVLRGLLLGLDPLDDLLPALGHDWAAYLVPRPADGGLLPADVVLAVDLPPANESERKERPDIRAALDNALGTGLNVLAAAWNSKPREGLAVVRRQDDEAGPRRWIESRDGFEPAYALLVDALLLATSPDAVAEFADDGQALLISDSRYRAVSQRHFPAAAHLLFVNVTGIRDLIAARREPLAARAAQLHGLEPVEAGRRLDAFRDALQLFDAAFAAVEIGPQTLRLVTGGVHHSGAAGRVDDAEGKP